jgi:uncharacterized protein YutE (UPF0331/DUF86 family)
MIKPKQKALIKLREMNKYLEELGGILPESESTYLHDLQTRRACEKTIELAIESVIDVIAIVVSHYTKGIPNSEDDLISILEKNKALSKKLSQSVKEMKGFRNILVHKYGKVDDKKAYNYLTHELKYFLSFEKEIKTYLKKRD